MEIGLTLTSANHWSTGSVRARPQIIGKPIRLHLGQDESVDRCLPVLGGFCITAALVNPSHVLHPPLVVGQPYTPCDKT